MRLRSQKKLGQENRQKYKVMDWVYELLVSYKGILETGCNLDEAKAEQKLYVLRSKMKHGKD